MALICDSGASLSCVADKDEFFELQESEGPTVLKGIATGLNIRGVGFVKYHLVDDEGKLIQLKAKAYWVPELQNLRLLAPQSLTTDAGEMVTLICHGPRPDGTNTFAELLVRKEEPEWHTKPPLQRLQIPYHPTSNLPELMVSKPGKQVRCARALTLALDVTAKANMNIKASQKELLKWHYRLGHVGFKWLQWLIRHGRIVTGNQSAIANCDPPKCAACEFGKGMKRPPDTSVTKPDTEKEMELKKGDLFPGQRVSVDHYQSKVPGRLYNSRGATAHMHMFHGGAIFMDHASGRAAIQHQISLSAGNTVKAKLHFKRGVVMMASQSNNTTRIMECSLPGNFLKS